MDKQETALLQHWLKDVITGSGQLHHKLQKAQHIYGMDEEAVISDEGKASRIARLNVYNTGYILRLLECLSADFPVLQKFVGDEVFYGFAKASLVWSPPVSYTLYDLGKNFIAFLDATRPVSSDNPMMDLPIELAKLERAKQEAMRAEGTETNAQQTDVAIEDILWQPHNIIISTPPCLRLLELKFPLKRFFEAVLKEESYNLPELKPTYIAVSRKHYRITMQELTDWQYHFLLSCKEPVSLMEAIGITARKCDTTASELMADLYIWLPLFQDSVLVTLTNS